MIMKRKILLTSCLVYGAVVGLIVSCSGQFYQCIADKLQVPLGSVTAGILVLGIASLFFTPLTIRLYRTQNPRLIVFLALLSYTMGNFGAAHVNTLGQYYGCCVLRGIGHGFLVYYIATDLIKSWYETNSGQAISITVFSSGILGIIANWVIGNVIEKAGWEAAMSGSSLLALAMSAPCVLLFLERSPHEERIPDGAAPKTARKKKRVFDEAKDPLAVSVFFAGMIMAVFWLLPYSYVQHIKIYAISEGFSQITGARLLSVSMAGNLISKFLLSIGIEKTGVKRSANLVLATVTAGFLIMMIPPTGFTLYLSALLMGVSAAQATVITPQVVSLVYKGEAFDRVYAHYSTALSVSGAFWTMILGVLYSAVGSYRPLFIMGLTVHLAGVAAMIYFTREGQKEHLQEA